MVTLATSLAFIQVLALSDVHYDHTATSTAYFKDTDGLLWSNAKSKMQDVIAKEQPAFIILLGDLPAHNTSDADRQLNDQTVLQDLRATVGSKTPLFYVPGNNDPLDGNYHSFTAKDGRNPTELDPAGSWPALNTVPCNQVVKGEDQPCTLDKPENLKLGYYSAYPLGLGYKLRFVGVNSIIFVAGYIRRRRSAGPGRRGRRCLVSRTAEGRGGERRGSHHRHGRAGWPRRGRQPDVGGGGGGGAADRPQQSVGLWPWNSGGRSG